MMMISGTTGGFRFVSRPASSSFPKMKGAMPGFFLFCSEKSSSVTTMWTTGLGTWAA
jgi:hypothetical protein